MKISKFQYERNKILVEASLKGEKREYDATFLVDTGASISVINTSLAQYLGYDLSNLPTENLSTASGLVKAKRIKIKTIEVFGSIFHELEIVVISIPPQTLVSGIIGMNLLRQFKRFCIDFEKSEISHQ